MIDCLLFIVALLSDGSVSRAAADTSLPPGTALVFEQREIAFGDRYQGGVVEGRFRFVNGSDRPVTILGTRSADTSAEVSISPTRLAPGDSGEMFVRQPLGNRLGRVSYPFGVRTDEADGSRHRVTLVGFVQSAYEPEFPGAEFGTIDRVTGGSAEIELFSREVERLELLGVDQGSPWVDVSVPARAGGAAEGLALLFSMRPGAPPGYLAGTITLRTNVEHQPTVSVVFHALIEGDIVPGENPLDLGAVRLEDPMDRQVMLRSRSGSPFEVARVEDSGGRIVASSGPCPEVPEDVACRRLALSIPAPRPGPLTGLLEVWIEGEAEPITISYRGVIVASGTEIRSIVLPGADGARERR